MQVLTSTLRGVLLAGRPSSSLHLLAQQSLGCTGSAEVLSLLGSHATRDRIHQGALSTDAAPPDAPSEPSTSGRASSEATPRPPSSQSTGRKDRGGTMLYGARMVQPWKTSGPQVVFQEGIVHICNTFNNCTISLTDLAGNQKAWTSCGSAGFKNSAKMKPLATEKAAEELAHKAMKLGFTNVIVKLKGVGRNKQYAVSALSKAGLRIKQLQEITPYAYNGCRLPRKRRV